MIGVIESGNSGNVHRALHSIGCDSETWTGTQDALVLPGVGHYGAFMRSIDRRAVRAWIDGGGKTLAICVGMQALYQWSEEDCTPGLGLLKGMCYRLEGRVPRVGWFPVDGTYYYFTHSFSAGADMVRYKNTLGVQFHPEKSGRAGMKLLAEWARD